MASLIEELQRREAADRREVDEPRGEIARLTERLARAEERLARLEITRETAAEILGGVGTDEAVGREVGSAAGGSDPVPAGPRLAGRLRSRGKEGMLPTPGPRLLPPRNARAMPTSSAAGAQIIPPWGNRLSRGHGHLAR
jgi:hypothetical protein